MKRHILLSTAIALVASSLSTANAETLDDAAWLLSQGHPRQALAIADSIGAAKPKDGAADLLAGQCYVSLGNDEEAMRLLFKAVDKKEIDAYLVLADIALRNYRPGDAETYIDDYKTYIKRNPKKRLTDESADISRRIERFNTMLDRVEDVVVIDSIIVDKEDFFKAYKLSPESGRLLPGTEALRSLSANSADIAMAYITEDGREMLWAEPDDDGTLHLMMADMLAASQWDEPVAVGDHLGGDGNAAFPYLMPDGITLYYASDSPDSGIGGYDIYISRNNGEEFLQPQNVGMPYNSPYDDYLLAIDELTGIGWWATDRNRIPDKVTIYIFVPSDLRNNIPTDAPDLIHRARLSSIADTQKDDTDVQAALRRIDAIRSVAMAQPDFAPVTLPDGRIVTRYSDLRSRRSVDLMKRTNELQKRLDEVDEELATLRKRYAQGGASANSLILSLEAEQRQLRDQITRTINDVVRSEGF